jgi:Zn-finger nucleic acid-binding protein
LIKHDRARRLEKRVNKNVPDLIKEAEISESDDLTEVIRCPACRNRMDKTLIEELEFHVDSCDNCDMAWFDGGELAQLQLAFENKPQTVELNRMRKRLKEMTDEERAEYEERIANLRDLGSPMEQAIAGATAELAIFYWWRLGRR